MAAVLDPPRLLPRLPRPTLAAHLAAFGALVLIGFAAFVYLVTLRHEADLIDRVVDARMDALARAPDRVAMTGPGAHVAETVAGRERLPARLRDLGPGRHLIGGEGQVEQVLVRDVGAARLVVVYGDAAHQQRLQQFRRVLLVLFVAAIAVAAVLARGWAHRLLRQRPSLRRRLAARAAERDGDPPFGADDARERLAIAYSSLQQGMAASLEREFIANVGHELRTPITMILTSCELMLENAALGERERAHLQRMAGAAEHMSDSVRSFLILAREGNLGRSEPVELLGCVLESLAPHRGALAERGVDVHASVGAEVSVVANREALFVVVSNLVRNAVKYTDHGGISIHHLGHTLYVADTGCGIPEGELPNIFLPFYRTRWASESGRDGLGLGLAIVKRICDHYGWVVEVKSIDGEGTRVSVDFTRAPSLFR